MAPEKNTSASDIEWRRRVLCSDESCIGVIGPDGRCKECGLAYKGELPWLGTDDTENEVSEAEEEVIQPEDHEDLSDDPDDWVEDGGEEIDDEWERRVLCSDESCIGVIGPDGRCKECGQPFRKA